MGYGEYDMIMFYRQGGFDQFLDPQGLFGRQTFGAMSIHPASFALHQIGKG